MKNGAGTSRRHSRPRSTTTRRQATTAAYDRGAFKTWAVANDVKLARGRAPRKLVDRFLAETHRK